MTVGSVVTAMSQLPWITSRSAMDWSLSEASGVFCGALIFLLRSRESKWFNKLLYFIISLVGGFSVAPDVLHALSWLPEWPAAFLSAAAIVTLATSFLDWAERTMPSLLTQFAHVAIGVRGGAGFTNDEGREDSASGGDSQPGKVRETSEEKKGKSDAHDRG